MQGEGVLKFASASTLPWPRALLLLFHSCVCARGKGRGLNLSVCACACVWACACAYVCLPAHVPDCECGCVRGRACVCVCVCVCWVYVCALSRAYMAFSPQHHSQKLHNKKRSRARALARTRALALPPSPRNLPRCVGEESAQALLSSFGGCVSALEMRFRCYDPVVHAHWRRSIRNGQDHLLAHEQLTCCKMWRSPIC